MIKHIFKFSIERGKLLKIRSFTEENDVWRYLLILLAMGLIRLPKISNYWQKDDDKLFGIEYFSNVSKLLIFIYN